MDGVVILGLYTGSAICRITSSRPLIVLKPVVTALRKYHNIDGEIDRDSIRMFGSYPTILPADHDRIIRVISGCATLTIGGERIALDYGDWGFVPRGVHWMVNGDEHFELCVARLNPKGPK